MRRWTAPSVVLACALALTGCHDLGSKATTGKGEGVISGDGWTTVDAADRGAPVDLRGATADGSPVDVAAWRGGVVVVNVWYAGCAPCRAEAHDLATTAADTAASGVHFVGVNTTDGAATVQAFDRRYAMPYPSVLDVGSGAALLSLRGTVPPQAVPSTVVLDPEGRAAGRIVGRLDPGVLRDLIQDAGGATGSSTGAPASGSPTATAAG